MLDSYFLSPPLVLYSACIMLTPMLSMDILTNGAVISEAEGEHERSPGWYFSIHIVSDQMTLLPQKNKNYMTITWSWINLYPTSWYH